MNTESVQCISQFTVYVRINIISELFKPVVKIKQCYFKFYSSNDPFILLYYFNSTINIVSNEIIQFVTRALL